MTDKPAEYYQDALKHAEAAGARDKAAIEDMKVFTAAMERRGAATMDELVEMLSPDDADYEELCQARDRFLAGGGW